MADIEIGYKGSTITSINSGGVTTLNTIGTFCEDNITVTFNKTQGEAFTPATTITTNPSITLSATTGTITAFYSGASNITPTVTSGYVSAGTAGTVRTSGTSTYQLSTVAAQTITPTTASQLAVASGRFTTGNIYVGAIPIPVFDVTWDNDWSDIIAVSCNMTYSECLDLCNNYDFRAMVREHDLAETDVGYIGATAYLEGGNTDVKYVVTATGGSPELDISYHQNGTISFNYPSSEIIDVTPTATKGAVSNNAINVTPSVPVPKSGFVIQGTRTGSPVTVSASELVSGTLSITSNGTYDVTEYASASINVAGGVGELTADDIAMRTFSGEISGVASFISINAFSDFTELKGANFPSCSSIGSGAFYNCHNLSSISFPVCKSIDASAFRNCTSLTVANFPLCESIGWGVFVSCVNLTVANFPSCSYIVSNAFVNCWRLSSISFPVCTSIGAYAFSECSSLTAANFPSCISIGSYAFSGCKNLSSVSFPVCTLISNYAFYYNSSLTIINFPSCEIIMGGAFAYCRSLNTAYFPACSSIYSFAFRNCYNLLSLYILSTSLCSLPNINAFTSTPISNYTASTGGVYGSIFVRASLYDSYKTATYWSVYSSRFVSLTDAQIEALGF